MRIGQPRVRKLRVLHHQYALVWAACAAPKAAKLQELAAMAEGKKKRTKCSLHRNIPVEFPTWFDKLCEPEGAQLINAAGEPAVDGVVGPSPSTLFSAGKSLKRQMQSANYFQLLNSAPPKAPAPPPLDPRKFAELLERVEQLEKRLEEQLRSS